MTKVLVVDDDLDLLELMQRFLSRYEMSVEVARSGVEMDQKLSESTFDIVILDIMLPGEDGLTLCRRIRTLFTTPIIMLTAVTETADRIVGLELGADDYVTKPFDSRELLARIRSVLRRASLPANDTANNTSTFRFLDWSVDVSRRELRRTDNTLVPISEGEFTLLLTLLEHPGRLLSRDQLLNYSKGEAHDVYDRSIDVLISRLRRKIEVNARRPDIIKTVRNAGYIFTPTVRSS